jgi:hypothetical protein
VATSAAVEAHVVLVERVEVVLVLVGTSAEAAETAMVVDTSVVDLVVLVLVLVATLAGVLTAMSHTLRLVFTISHRICRCVFSLF